MTEPCLPFDELLALSEGSRDDPRWAHVHGCARCRSRLKAYGLYIALGQEAPHAGEEQAVARLAETLQARIGSDAPVAEALPTGVVGPDELPSPAGSPRPSPRGRLERAAQGPTRWGGLLQLLRPPRMLVPALGAAAILVGIVLIARDEPWWPRGSGWPGSSGGPVLREQPTSQEEPALSVFPARPLADGGVELRWSAIASADAYRVRILDPGLQEIACLDAGAETRMVIPAASLRTWSVQAAFWHVEALAQGDRIVDSAPTALPRDRDR